MHWFIFGLTWGRMSRDTRAWICAVGPTSLRKKAVVTLRAWLFMFVCRVFKVLQGF